jgi:hypothetical protein
MAGRIVNNLSTAALHSCSGTKKLCPAGTVGLFMSVKTWTRVKNKYGSLEFCRNISKIIKNKTNHHVRFFFGEMIKM